jgi:GT2 family glycosyltransferase
VLFHESDDAVLRAVAALSGAIGIAREHGLDGEVVLAHGDSGRERLSDEMQARIIELADEQFEYHYEFFGDNLGTARGQNRLAAAWPATWQLTTNPDVVFGGTAIQKLFARSVDATVGALEARQLPVELPKVYDPATGDTSWGSGACTMVRGDLWRQIGGYDDDHFFLHGDDVDLSWRIRLEGYRVVHVPEARAFHDKRIGGSIEPSEIEVFHSAMAAFLMAAKWGEEVDRDRVRDHLAGPRYSKVREAIGLLQAEERVPVAVPDRATVASFNVDGHFGAQRY